MSRRPRVLVCGTGFGRVHLAALADPRSPFELAGVLARGGARSRACAAEAGVPLYTRVADLPDGADGADLACVVLLGDVNGGPGSAVAGELMARGVPVLQEGPLLRDELAASLRAARRHQVVFRVNTHYVHLPPVRRFVAAARALRAEQQPLWVEAACGIQVAYHLVDVLGRALGGLRPYEFAACGTTDGPRTPFRTLEGVLAGVPVTLRVQNQLHPADPDNHAHLLYRITVGAEGGSLTLLDPHGPVVWSPRPHLPAAARNATRLHDAADAHLDFPACVPLGPAEAPSYREILARMWPAAARRAISTTWAAVRDGMDTMSDGQYHLAVSGAWQEMTAALGFPERLAGPPPRPLPAGPLLAAALREAASQEESDTLEETTA
ncbi:Gfo/Idh/MocA family oxidoreductase [Nonomuraea indica]|uniref:Gfo/Idh/MocA family oxidoreductase n=1 Tax=Nonomuraea indica TaxID=1581193 RepID=A0ABW8AFI5_9ACTN